jgi:hypothetical protein
MMSNLHKKVGPLAFSRLLQPKHPSLSMYKNYTTIGKNVPLPPKLYYLGK